MTMRNGRAVVMATRYAGSLGRTQRHNLPLRYKCCITDRALSSYPPTDDEENGNISNWTLERDDQLMRTLQSQQRGEVLDSDIDIAQEVRMGMAAAAAQSDYRGVVEKYVKGLSDYNQRNSIGAPTRIPLPFEYGIGVLLPMTHTPNQVVVQQDPSSRRNNNELVQKKDRLLLADQLMEQWWQTYETTTAASNEDPNSHPLAGKHGGILLGDLIVCWCQLTTATSSSINNKDFQMASERAHYWLETWVNTALARSKGTQDGASIRMPPALVFGAVLDAHAKGRSLAAALKAEEVLTRLLGLHKDYGENAGLNVPVPNSILYTSVVDAWARSYAPQAANKAQEWLERMQADTHLSPEEKCNERAYGAVIMAHARSGKENSANLAEGILLEMLKQPEQNNVDIFIYNGIIDAWARQVGAKEGEKVKGGGKEERRFQNKREELLKRDWEHANNAEKWLNLLLKNLDGPSSSSHHVGPAVVPDVITFNSVINAFSRITKSKEAAERAEYWFDQMQKADISPSGITYGSLIRAWGNTKCGTGARRASHWLDEYERAGRNSTIEPHNIPYTFTLNAWADSSNSVEQGVDDRNHQEAILPKMISLLNRMEQCQTVPNSPNAALVPPDTVAYNTILKACMYQAHRDPRQALKISLELLDRIKAGTLQPDFMTFTSILNCFCFCVTAPESRSHPKYVEQCQIVLDECCKKGLVTNRVLQDLRRALVPPDSGVTIYRHMLEDKGIALLQQKGQGKHGPVGAIPWELKKHVGVTPSSMPRRSTKNRDSKETSRNIRVRAQQIN